MRHIEKVTVRPISVDCVYSLCCIFNELFPYHPNAMFIHSYKEERHAAVYFKYTY